MSEQLLQVRNLSVSVEDKPILHGIDLEVRPGETHVLMGPNGAGKSTLGYTIMGSPRYEVTGGEILFKGKELLEETADQRAKDGIFLSFQNPLEVPGVSLRNFIRNAVEQRSGSRIKLWTFKKELEQAMEVLQMKFPVSLCGTLSAMRWNREVVPASSCGHLKRNWRKLWKSYRWILPTVTVT